MDLLGPSGRSERRFYEKKSKKVGHTGTPPLVSQLRDICIDKYLTYRYGAKNAFITVEEGRGFLYFQTAIRKGSPTVLLLLLWFLVTFHMA